MDERVVGHRGASAILAARRRAIVRTTDRAREAGPRTRSSVPAGASSAEEERTINGVGVRIIRRIERVLLATASLASSRSTPQSGEIAQKVALSGSKVSSVRARMTLPLGTRQPALRILF